MNNLEQAVIAIAMYCGVYYESPNFTVSKQAKIDCIEKLTNCAVDFYGNIDAEKVKDCVKKEEK